MSKPAIVYFPVRGRAELSRYVLAAAGVEWDEIVLTRESLQDLKASGRLAFGQIPLLQIDGLDIVQSNAMARYLARKYDLYGDLKAAVTADVIIEGINDFLLKLVPIAFPPQKDKLAEFVKTVLPTFLTQFENILRQNNNGDGWVSGDKFTLGDLALFYMEETFTQDRKFENEEAIPKLLAHYKRVAAIPNIAAYLASEKRYPPENLI